MPVSSSFTRNIAYDAGLSFVTGAATSSAASLLAGRELRFGAVDLASGVVVAVVVGAVLLVYTVTTEQDFVVEFRDGSGENAFHEVESGGLDEWPQRSWVKLRFLFESRYAFTVTDVDLQYQPSQSLAHRDVHIEVGDETVETDGNYNVDPFEIPADSPVDVFVRRSIEAWEPPRASDYGDVVLELRGSTPDWRGFKTVRVTGSLEPGGTFDVADVAIVDGWWTETATRVRDALPALGE
ncbi:MAG: hypothetical protein ABEH83_12550 [Halobacterium sp.]